MTNTATVEMIKNIINGVTPLGSRALRSAFPVGRVYISVDEVSPASLFGGTWEKIEKKFLYGTGGRTYRLNGRRRDAYAHVLRNAKPCSSISIF